MIAMVSFRGERYSSIWIPVCYLVFLLLAASVRRDTDADVLGEELEGRQTGEERAAAVSMDRALFFKRGGSGKDEEDDESVENHVDGSEEDRVQPPPKLPAGAPDPTDPQSIPVPDGLDLRPDSPPTSKPAPRPSGHRGSVVPSAPLSAGDPRGMGLQRRSNRYIKPFATAVKGPKQTNKFWANWVVQAGINDPIFPMPYALKVGPNGIIVSHNDKPQTHSNTAFSRFMHYYSTPFQGEVAIGAKEGFDQQGGAWHKVVKEGLFGFHAELRKGGGTVTFPIYSGAVYISGKYSGLTPKVAAAPGRGLTSVKKIRNGIWQFKNNGGKTFRVYALTSSGFVGSEYDFDQTGSMNRQLNGWVRVAREQVASDQAALDNYATAVLTDMILNVERNGRFEYKFQTEGQGTNLHFAWATHRHIMKSGATKVDGLKAMRAPTKGYMQGYAGREWTLQVRAEDVRALDFLPAQKPAGGKEEFLKDDAVGVFHWFKNNWQHHTFRDSYYFTGKNLQKLGYICLMLEQYYGQTHDQTKECASLLKRAMSCIYKGGSGCNGSPPRLIYDEPWGGVVSPNGYSNGCQADFGNSCFNDHHYHYGYFVLAGAILAKLDPSAKKDAGFTNFISSLIRDVANPSDRDDQFPQFRSFDWFDLHSWSRGVHHSVDGKDQESTSEELNFYFGLYLWGKYTGNSRLQELGETMTAADVTAIRTFFTMKNANPDGIHPDPYQKNHASGIFLQNQVKYGTWFSQKKECIHGIQMLPLIPVLLLTRTRDFVQEEWDTVLREVPLNGMLGGWSSIILTGSVALLKPDEAYDKLCELPYEKFDDGLTKTWTLYWAASQQGASPSTRTKCSGSKQGKSSGGNSGNTGAGGGGAACSANPGCAHLSGNCCPASTGMQLACCR